MANIRADIVGGHNLVSMRAHFDQNGKNVIVASNRELFYYDIKTCEQAGRVSVVSSKLEQDEAVVSCEMLDNLIYLTTNHGLVFIWSIEMRDWLNEIALPINEQETLVCCKMLSKRQYLYTVLDNESQKATLYYSMSRSERERPKQREIVGKCASGQLNTFDIGCLVSQSTLDQETSKNIRDKQAKQRCLVYIDGSYVHFQRLAIGEKFNATSIKQRIKDLELTCVRANSNRPLIAAGDTLGRIYVYTGDFIDEKFNRTKLHWHTLPVNDLCFSSTGNTLFSVGGESGCVVIWDLTQDNLGKKRVVARLGMPIRYLNCSYQLNQLVLSFEDNEIQFMDTSDRTRHLKIFTRRTIDMYKRNDCKALRIDTTQTQDDRTRFVGLLWHSKTDTVVTNARTGWLQFYSPKAKTRIHALNFLKSNILSLEKEATVIPSDITRAALTLDGNWLAFYETRESANSFPEVKLHIWQQSSATNRWVWIQTADRLHASASIADLKYSPDGQFLISVSEDGTFHVLHRVSLDAKANTNSKQMYAKGFVGNVPSNLPCMATFSQDSSVMAMSLKNDTTLIWMIVDPYKLVYECQLNQIDSDVEQIDDPDKVSNPEPSHQVLGLHFGYHKPAESLAPLCEVRSNSIRIWNILNSQETMEYSATEVSENADQEEEFTAAAFDQCPGDSRSLDHFAVCTKSKMILIFRLQISTTTRNLRPLVTVDGTVLFSNSLSHYTHMCFLADPILEIDPNCHSDPQLVKLLNRLCLMNKHMELVSITDSLTIERRSSSNGCNAIRTIDITEIQAYLAQNMSAYQDETRNLGTQERLNSSMMTERQRKIRNRLEVQKMLKDLLHRIPSQNLPKMDILGPMILDKLV